jgi:Helix-turn-helix domain
MPNTTDGHSMKITSSGASPAEHAAAQNADDFLTTEEASAVVRYAPTTLNRLRVQGGGPVFYRLGRKILYSRSDLIAFVRAKQHASTSEYGV